MVTKENSYRYKEEIAQLDIPEWKKTIAYENTPYTVLHMEAIVNLIDITERIVQNNIPGDFVECGVHAGGCCMIMAQVLKHYSDERTIWMYDTYDGIPIPDDTDVWTDGRPLTEIFNETNRLDEDDNSSWCYTSLEHVKENMQTFDYRGDIKYIKGLVEDTIPVYLPDTIALLRIDVDLAVPTKHCLENLYQLMVKDGQLTLDDYGHFPMVKQVVDDYLGSKIHELVAVGYTIRNLIK
jgi:O-methyltransferase